MPDRTPVKTCNRCGVEKPLDGFAKASWCTDGRRGTCRACRDHGSTVTVTEKVCAGCGETKAAAEYGKHSVARDGLQARCKPCRKLLKAASHERNRARNNERSRAAYAANREERIAAQIAWKKANPEKVREYARIYQERHRERANETARLRVAKRYALKLKNTVGEVDTDALWADQNGACGICGIPIDIALRWPHSMSRSIDHIHPLARGGAHSQENLQWAHLVCNIRKGAKAP